MFLISELQRGEAGDAIDFVAELTKICGKILLFVLAWVWGLDIVIKDIV